jgi:RNA polymerase sigma-70 factor (ECF subfamily)
LGKSTASIDIEPRAACIPSRFGDAVRMLPGAPPACAPHVAVGPGRPGPDHWATMIVQMRQGNEGALQALQRASMSTVYRTAFRVTRDPHTAEEVAASTFWQAWRQADRFDSHRGDAKAWLLRIARTRAIDALRHVDPAGCQADPAGIAETRADLISDPQEAMLVDERAAAVRAAVARLAPLRRQLVALAFFRGLTHDEIAERTNLPLGTVKTHIRKALAELRTALSEESKPVAAAVPEPPRSDDVIVYERLCDLLRCGRARE